MTCTRSLRLVALCGLVAAINTTVAAPAAPQSGGPAPTSSIMVQVVEDSMTPYEMEDPHALRAVSLFAIAPPEPRQFEVHDLVQIIVRESSRANSTQELDLEKDYGLDAKVAAWPDINLEDLLNLQLYAGRTEDLPQAKIGVVKEFDGDGEYDRTDDLTARLTAEVIEILPNGNLVLEARTRIALDEEESTMQVTGICRPDDITPANAILSNQIHDLTITKVHEGELKKTSEKGIIARVLDTMFAF